MRIRVAFCWANLGSPLGISIGASLLARELLDAGAKVHMVHWHEELHDDTTAEAVAQMLLVSQPDILLVSFGTNQATDVKKLLDLCRLARPDIPVLSGGLHPTYEPEEVLSWGSVDAVFMGEADGRIAEIVRRMTEGRSIEHLSNVATRNEAFLLMNDCEAPPDIRDHGFPSWESFDYEKVMCINHGFVNVITGRGCPFRCIYCFNSVGYYERHGSFIKSIRKRNVANIIGELEQYVRRFGEKLSVFNFGDDSFVLDRAWLEEFVEAYRERIGSIPFAANVTLNHIDEHVAGLLAEAGCYMVRFGLESGSERLRRFLRRPNYRLLGVNRAVSCLRDAHINIKVYVMVGIPTESREELLETFRLAGQLRVDSIRPSIFFPYPRTPAHSLCLRKGLFANTGNVGNYFEKTILRWDDPALEALINHVIQVQSALLNAALEGEEYDPFRSFQKEIFDSTKDDWEKGLAVDLHERMVKACYRLSEERCPHYIAPVSGRPELCYLVRDRKVPIPNITWNTRMQSIGRTIKKGWFPSHDASQ